jgi:CBS domain-containing protein
MRRAKVRRLPVINESGVVQGILTLNDIELRVDRAHAADLSYEQVINTIKAIDEHRQHAGLAPAERKSALAAAS